MRAPPDFSKRFIAFEVEPYYPSGGMDDAIGSYATLEEAWEQSGTDHVYDQEERRVINERPPSKHFSRKEDR